MKVYTVNRGGIEYSVQLEDETAQKMGAVPVETREGAPSDKGRKVANKGRKVANKGAADADVSEPAGGE